MSFTSRQQGLYRPMVARAWVKEAAARGLPVCNKAAKDAWYRAELRECLGRDTTRDADPGRHFEIVMAHFEALVGGELYWNLRVFQGDTRRLQFNISRICERWEIDDAYARATAAKVLKWEGYLDSLAKITDPKDLQRVRIALLRHAHRQGKREDHAAAQAVNAPAEPRAPIIARTAEVPELRAIDREHGATEAEFESDGVRQRREAKAAQDAAAQKTARQFFNQAKRSRKATQSAASEVEIDPENCPF